MDSTPNLQSSINSQVPSSLSSPSCPSEPPDVGNWFSSYEYQSPNLDSSFTLQDSAFRICESQQQNEELVPDLDKVRVQDERVVKEKVVQCGGTCDKDDNHNKEKNLDHCSSCSYFSEPPDIRNWFSSYVYESSSFDTSSLLVLSDEEVSEGNKCGEERFDFEVINKDEGQSENVQPKVGVEHNSSFHKTIEGDGGAGLKKNLTIVNTPCLEKILQPCMEDEALQHSLVSTKDELMVNQNHGSPGCNGEACLMSLDTDTCATRLPKLVQKNDTTKELESKSEIQAEKPDISTSLAKSFSTGSSTCTRNTENDGFVTTRKNSCNRLNDKNSCKKPENTLSQCSKSTGAIPLACEKNGVAKRKALAEATNLQHSNVTEITGKWQCPQKRKPDRGPALKQLRLERWVHKVGKISPH